MHTWETIITLDCFSNLLFITVFVFFVLCIAEGTRLVLSSEKAALVLKLQAAV